MTRARAVFFGTPEAAIPSLTLAAETFEVTAVITQPPRRRGRGRAVSPTPVAAHAQQLGLEVLTPGDPVAVADAVRSVGDIDVGIVVAYGQLIRPVVLSVPRAGFVNLHFSLLPRWRGAAPVARAMMAGDERCGATVMLLVAGLDEGPVFTTWSVSVDEDANAGSLTNRLAGGGASLLVRTVADHLEGRAAPVEQPLGGVTYAAKLSADDRRIRWDRPASEVRRHVQALSPVPGAQTVLEGHPFQVLAARVSHHVVGDEPERPGRGIGVSGEPFVWCGDGAVRLELVRPAGRQAMDGAAWLRGRRGESFAFESAG